MEKRSDSHCNANPVGSSPTNRPSRFGRYQVEGVLGRGETGTVYLAKDPLLGRAVAIKAFRDPTNIEAQREGRARFEREIHVAGTFAHPNIVTVHDVGLDERDSFIAMEYVDGGSLEQMLAREPVLPLERALGLAAQVGGALDYAHEHGVVHRDVKPGNILLTSTGTPKVADFGVARLAGSTLTRHGTSYGSPAYMSPEQATAQELTGASDQFSLAVVVYEMLTGELPFTGESVTAIVFRILEHDPVPPELLNPLVPEEAGAVLMRALSKRPQERFPSCSAFARALQEATGLSQSSQVVGVAPRPIPMDTEAVPRKGGTTERYGLIGSVLAHAAVVHIDRFRSGQFLALLAIAAVFVVAGYSLLTNGLAGAERSAGQPDLDDGALVSPANDASLQGPSNSNSRTPEFISGSRSAGTARGAPGRDAERFPTRGDRISGKLAERAANAADVLTEVMNTPERGIPRSMLAASRCVAVIPGVKKVGFGLGGRYGRGLVSCRTSGGWSRPSFIAIGGGSVGLQIGGQSTDLVLVFVNRRAAERLTEGRFLLGGDASVAAGPVGRTGEADTDVRFETEIYSYSRSRGLFAGASLEGATLTTDTDANAEAYGNGVTAADLLFGRGQGIPPELLVFVRRLEQHAT